MKKFFLAVICLMALVVVRPAGAKVAVKCDEVVGSTTSITATSTVDRSHEVLGALKKLDGRLGGLATAASVKELETKVSSIEANVASQIQADRLLTDGVLSAISGDVIATKKIATEARDYSKTASEGVKSLSEQVGSSSNLLWCFAILAGILLAVVTAVVLLIRRDLKKSDANTAVITEEDIDAALATAAPVATVTATTAATPVTPATPATPAATATAAAAPAAPATP